MKKLLWKLSAVLACAALAGGCINRHTTVHNDVERVRVQFENEAAGRIFFEKLSKLPTLDHKESRTAVCIPIILDYERRVVTDDSEKFNQAVRQCDTNGDGMITETEARIFAARP